MRRWKAWIGNSLLALLILLLYLAPSEQGGSELDEGPFRPHGSVTARVLRVIDGDTISVRIGDGDEDVRYIGIDTPETVDPDTPPECYGKRASRLNEQLVGGEEVVLSFDDEIRDRYDRLLAYVRVGQRFVNAEILRLGAARTLEIEPNTDRALLFSRLQRQASAHGRGLWSMCGL
jgi:micrococcal nuclease